MVNVSKNPVKATRVSLGMTQEAFAEAVGVNRATVIQWEKTDAERPSALSQASIDRVVAERRGEYSAPKPTPAVVAERPTESAGEMPKLANVNVTYSDKETLVAVRLAHREFAQQQNEQSWAYSVKVVNLVLESIRKAFDGAPPLTANPDEGALLEDAFRHSREEGERMAAETLQESTGAAARTEPKAAGDNRR